MSTVLGKPDFTLFLHAPVPVDRGVCCVRSTHIHPKDEGAAPAGRLKYNAFKIQINRVPRILSPVSRASRSSATEL